jgi:hypothetical protein
MYLVDRYLGFRGPHCFQQLHLEDGIGTYDDGWILKVKVFVIYCLHATS